MRVLSAICLCGVFCLTIVATALAQPPQQPAARRPLPQPGYFGVLAANDPAGEGAVLRAIVTGSPADRAGLRIGDVVTRVADVLVFNAREMIDELSLYGPGETVTLSVKQSGFVRDAEVALGERPGEAQRSYPQFGRVAVSPPSAAAVITAPSVSPLADNTPPDRRLGIHTVAANPAALSRRRLPDRAGALVVRVERDSPADLAGIPQSALIVAVDGDAIDSPAALESALGRAGALIEVTYCIGDDERTAKLER